MVAGGGWEEDINPKIRSGRFRKPPLFKSLHIDISTYFTSPHFTLLHFTTSLFHFDFFDRTMSSPQDNSIRRKMMSFYGPMAPSADWAASETSGTGAGAPSSTASRRLHNISNVEVCLENTPILSSSFLCFHFAFFNTYPIAALLLVSYSYHKKSH